MYKNFIWDFDGTLFNTYPKMLKAYVKTMQDFKVDIEPAEIYRMLKTASSKDLAEKYHLDFKHFDQVYKNYEKSDQTEVFAYDDAKKTLASIAKAGGQHFLLTHRENQSAQALLNSAELADFFIEIVGPENKFPRKPDPTSLNYIIEKYHLNRNETVMIGDRPMDIDAGIGANVATIFYNDERLFTIDHAKHEVHSLLEIAKYI